MNNLTTRPPGVVAGAPSGIGLDTGFFQRADMMDTPVGTDDSHADPANVRTVRLEAMAAAVGDVVARWNDKRRVAAVSVMPASVPAEQHHQVAEPGSAR